MDERLKQIWSGFEQTTERRLVGNGVDNITVPHRVDYAAADEAFLPENFDAPAEAAFAALRGQLEKQERRFSFKRRGRGKTSAGDGDNQSLEGPFDGDQLIKGLKATSLRTERPERDYAAFLSSDEGRAVLKKHKKKKRFGIF